MNEIMKYTAQPLGDLKTKKLPNLHGLYHNESRSRQETQTNTMLNSQQTTVNKPYIEKKSIIGYESTTELIKNSGNNDSRLDLEMSGRTNPSKFNQNLYRSPETVNKMKQVQRDEFEDLMDQIEEKQKKVVGGFQVSPEPRK